MSHPEPVTDSGLPNCVDDAAPDDPFTSLSVHFGMLLGVDDFETEQAYHRGRLRLHQGWLHGPGVAWGLAVSVDVERGEVRVEPGLAVDGAGRELHLDDAACLDPRAWLDLHDAEVDRIDPPPAGADVAFDAHVEARWASCLTRPVPALAEPCEDAGIETAPSRRWETVELRLVPGATEAPADRHRRVRIVLGLLEPGAEPADQEAAQARADVLAAPEGNRAAAALSAFRAMANADALELSPTEPDEGSRALTPAAPPAPVVLADLRAVALRRRPDDTGWELVGGEVDLLSRRSHVATETVQELTVAALARHPGLGPAAGPQVTSATLSGTELVLALSAPLDERSVQPAAFSVTALGASGWEDVALAAPPAHDAAGPSVTLTLAAEPAAPWQLVARGTGRAPLVDAETNPLGGGSDHVHLQRS